jgi:hypothetical protein
VRSIPSENPPLGKSGPSIFDNQTSFAQTKLDIGQFSKFIMSLDIDADIPAEKQRPMFRRKTSLLYENF